MHSGMYPLSPDNLKFIKIFFTMEKAELLEAGYLAFSKINANVKNEDKLQIWSLVHSIC